MTAAQINAKVTEAIAAQEAGDYATAITKLESAQMMLAAMPDQRSGDEGLTWNRTAIDNMLARLAGRQAAATVRSRGIQRTRIRYVKPRRSGGSRGCDD